VTFTTPNTVRARSYTRGTRMSSIRPTKSWPPARSSAIS